MVEFKVGNYVRMTNDCSGSIKGNIYLLRYDNTYGNDNTLLYAWDKEVEKLGKGGCSCHNKWELVEDIKKINADQKSEVQNMDLVSIVKNMFRTEPEKSFIKAGIMNSDNSLTIGGKEVFINYLFELNKADFNTKIVQPLLTEQEAEKSK